MNFTCNVMAIYGIIVTVDGYDDNYHDHQDYYIDDDDDLGDGVWWW